MEVKQAVEVAKKYVADLFIDEGIANLGLEEVEKKGTYWNITIGFSRPWDSNIGAVLGGVRSRTYKTIMINDQDGHILAVKNRIFSEER